MNRSFLYGLVGLVGVAGVGLVPLACTAGGVGVPCIPEDEYSFRFPGFKVTEDIIESRSFQCATRICLVNHFQGRVSCPLGQPAPKDAQGLEGCEPERDGNGNFQLGRGSCSDGSNCVEAGSFSPSCVYTADNDDDDVFCQSLGAGAKCNEAGFCECATNADCIFVTDAVVSCDQRTKQCISYACHKPGDCQLVGATNKDNAGKACCLPGSDTPITTHTSDTLVATLKTLAIDAVQKADSGHPGLPMGAPGREPTGADFSCEPGCTIIDRENAPPRREFYDTLLVLPDGKTKVWARH